jgi:hypothetical protein
VTLLVTIVFADQVRNKANVDPPVNSKPDERAGRESILLNHVIQSSRQVLFQNDQRSFVSEVFRCSTTELRRNVFHQSRAGGIRTHDNRLVKHVLQLGS